MKIFQLYLALCGHGALPLARSQVRELHPDLTHQRDFSKSTHQFNLKSHLMAPTDRDHREGIKNSRRLARNAIKLGIDDQTHRDLVKANQQTNDEKKSIVKKAEFIDVPLPSKSYRIKVDGTVASLPFGDGPGFFPNLPKGTKAFWDGSGVPTTTWEIVACPVADIHAYLQNPLRCMLGVNGNDKIDGSILDFFSSIDGKDIMNAMQKAIVPLAVEFVYNFSGMKWIENVLSGVCKILSLVDDIIAIIKSMADWSKDAADAAGEFIDDVGSFFGFRERHLQGIQGCTGNYQPCPGAQHTCSGCFKKDGGKCPGCHTCFQPLQNAVPEMEGICLDTEKLRAFVTSPAPPIMALQSYYSIMTARYMKKVSSEDVIAGITSMRAGIKEELKTAETAIKTYTDTAKSHLETKIDNQCRRRRLGEEANSSSPLDAPTSEEEDDDWFDKFMRSEQAQEAKQYASGKGLNDDHVDMIFSKILNGLSEETSGAFDDKIGEEVKKALNDPEKMAWLDKLLDADVERNLDTYTGNIIGLMLEEATDKQTRRLDIDELQDTVLKLKEIRETRKLSTNTLVGKCTAAITSLAEWIKNLLTKVLTDLVDGIANLGGAAKTVFNEVQTNPAYKASTEAFAFAGVNLGTSPLLMSFGLFQAFDPWSGVLNGVMGAVVTIFQTIAGWFMYGCDVHTDATCQKLPSIENEVISDSFRQRRGETDTMYLTSGCSSEFEGEILFYSPAFEIIDKLLDAAGDSIVEFLNIPIKVVQFIVQAAAMLFSNMNDVCSYLGGNVNGALVAATHENSRYALHELACRKPFETHIPLRRGYGCDGLDNTCDDDKKIDECEEDIFPPEIDATSAIKLCADKTFATAQEATECFQAPGRVLASDDCNEVALAITDKGNAPLCSATMVIEATAQGCGGRIPEDVTQLEVDVDVDGDAPVVDCIIDAQNLCGSGGMKNLWFSYTAVDGGDKCTASADLDISIEVLSNEVAETGQEMVMFSTRVPNHPTIFVEDLVCGKCKVSSHPKNTRQYDVLVTATDKAGNVGTAICSTKIGSQDIDTNDPLFLLKKIQFVGGNTAHKNFNVPQVPCQTGKYYVIYPEMKCAKNCDSGLPLPCMGHPPDDSGVPAQLFATVEECCRGKLWWVDEGTCVSETNGNVPNPPLGSTKWHVNYSIDQGTCVQDCVGASPCGGLKGNFSPGFSTAALCCDSIPWKTVDCALA